MSGSDAEFASDDYLGHSTATTKIKKKEEEIVFLCSFTGDFINSCISKNSKHPERAPLDIHTISSAISHLIHQHLPNVFDDVVFLKVIEKMSDFSSKTLFLDHFTLMPKESFEECLKYMMLISHEETMDMSKEGIIYTCDPLCVFSRMIPIYVYLHGTKCLSEIRFEGMKETLLTLAARFYPFLVIEILFENGIDPLVRNEVGLTALDYCFCRKSITFLLKKAENCFTKELAISKIKFLCKMKSITVKWKKILSSKVAIILVILSRPKFSSLFNELVTYKWFRTFMNNGKNPEFFCFFKTNTREVIHSARVLGNNKLISSEWFSLLIGLGDGFIEFSEGIRGRQRRFFSICSKLPMEIQMLICHRVVGSMSTSIPKIYSEQALLYWNLILTMNDSMYALYRKSFLVKDGYDNENVFS
jgi:hypothetical protein